MNDLLRGSYGFHLSPYEWDCQGKKDFANIPPDEALSSGMKAYFSPQANGAWSAIVIRTDKNVKDTVDLFKKGKNMSNNEYSDADAKLKRRDSAIRKVISKLNKNVNESSHDPREYDARHCQRTVNLQAPFGRLCQSTAGELNCVDDRTQLIVSPGAGNNCSVDCLDIHFSLLCCYVSIIRSFERPVNL
jgi:hypothetical protein